jgi:hypothetical protein
VEHGDLFFREWALFLRACLDCLRTGQLMGNREQTLRIGGRILISPDIPAVSGGVAHIRLEEISRQDAESVAITETIIDGIEHGRDGTSVSFHLQVPESKTIDPNGIYSIRVWIDIDGDGKPGPKDLFSDRAYRVLTQGYGNTIEIRL